MRRTVWAIAAVLGVAASVALWIAWPRLAPAPVAPAPEITLAIPPPAFQPAPPPPAPAEPPPAPAAVAPPAVTAPPTPPPAPPSVASVPTVPPPPPPEPLVVDRKVIIRVQYLLEQVGYGSGNPDGVLGKRTKQSIVAFRRGAGLPPGDMIDERLIEALELANQQQTALRRTEGVPAAAPRVPVERVPLSN